MESDTFGPMVLDTLTKACSQTPDILRPAEEQLQHWQTQPGFYTILSSIFCNHEIDVNVRWLAVMYVKNGVDRYWRKTAPNAMHEEEKEIIRQRLLGNFNEPSSQICTQMAVLVAKVARVDCPRNWPNLLPALLQSVRCDNQLLQERSLLVLHHVVKTLASKRLPPDRKLFEDLATEIFGYLYGLWTDQITEFLQMASQHSENMMVILDRAILSLRILRRLATFGFRDPASNQETMSFFNQVFIKLDAVMECRQSLWGNHKMIEKCEKMINILTKVLLDSLEQHPVFFMQFITRTLEFVVRYNFTQAGTYGDFEIDAQTSDVSHGIAEDVSHGIAELGLLFERFTVNCFNLMKDILICESYRPGKHEIEPDNTKMQAHKIKQAFFNYNTLTEICQRLISQYFLLNHDDLMTWDSSPEEFCQEEVGDTYKYSLRPCTETLFLSLFKEYRMTLSAVVLKMMQDIQGPCDMDNMVVILRKDAVYNAVGLAAFDLFDDVDFDLWFTSHLVQELNIKHVKIIRRRVIRLCGQWVGVKLSSSLRPLLYQAILPLLQANEDLVVRIEAANTLKLAVDDFEFKVDQFLPYLESSFSLLFQLLKEVTECDTKMQILHVISFVIERVGAQIRPYATSLITYLPSLWEESQEHNMLRCAILTTLIHLVQGFGTLSSAMYDFLLPVIEMSTDTKQPQHVYLMEDGLELWHVTLMSAEKINPQLLSLYKNMKDLLELGTENLRMCLKVIEAYLLLGPREFLESYSTIFVKSISSLMSDLRTEGMVLVLKIVELVFKSFPTEGPQLFKSLLPGFLQAILEKDEHPVVISLYLTLFGWIVLQNKDFFWTFIEQMAKELKTDSSTLLQMMLTVWLDSIDSMTQPERRKLSALALASLLTVNINVILENFGQIISVCVQVLHDVCRVPVDEEAVIQLDALVISDGDEIGEDESETEHEKRKRSLTRKDPVHSIPLKEYVFQQLRQCHNIQGDDVFDKLTKQIDPDVFKQLQEFSKS